MILSYFDRNPHEKVVKNGLLLSFILFIILFLSVNSVYEASKYPVSFMESQLSFSGSVIKSHYNQMTKEDIRIYQIAQIVDYGFLICYGMFIFFVGIYIGRYWFFQSQIRQILYLFGVIGVGSACCDAVENGFILAMTCNSLDFPDIYAILHSVFALIKFSLLGCIIFLCSGLFFIHIIWKSRSLFNHN